MGVLGAGAIDSDARTEEKSADERPTKNRYAVSILAVRKSESIPPETASKSPLKGRSCFVAKYHDWPFLVAEYRY